MKTLFFFDTETSGVLPDRHGIIQIAWIIEKDGIILSERIVDVNQGSAIDYNLDALEINNFTLDRIRLGVNPHLVFKMLYDDLKEFVGGGSALIPCGHNVRFDIDMLYSMSVRYNATWWLNFGHNDYLSLRNPVCTMARCHYLNCEGKLSLTDYKLGTVCKHFNIKLEGAHDALQDVRATRTLFHKLKDI